MDVRQLAAIVAVADQGTFSGAARVLFTVQSNVSGHVAKLERELGTELFDRSTSTITEAGERVVARARRILNEIDDLAADIESDDGQASGDARIGVIGTTARWLMPQLLSAVDHRHPRVHPIVSEGPTTSLVAGLLDGTLNAAILHLPVEEPALFAEPLFAEELLLLVPASHAWADRSEVPLAELANEPVLLPPTGTAMRRVLDRAAHASDIRLKPQAEIDGVRLLASLAFDQYGLAIVPATAAPSQEVGDFRRINVPELPRRVVAWVRPRRPDPSAAVSAVHSVLVDVINTHAAEQPGIHLDIESLSIRP